LIKDAGIATFAELADTDPEKLKEILAEAGSRYRMHDPTTWPAQSKMVNIALNPAKGLRAFF